MSLVLGGLFSGAPGYEQIRTSRAARGSGVEPGAHAMKPISAAKIIQIEVTDACFLRCANCSRLVGHRRTSYFMPLSQVADAIASLTEYDGVVGIVGGEPTLHPQFTEICDLLRAMRPREKCAVFTSGHKWDAYKDVIWRTFGHGVFFNDHTDPRQRHQPVLVAIGEAISDKALMRSLIEKCWVQESWSPSVAGNGAFFCEVAAALDNTFKMGGGYRVDANWWRRTPAEFADQVARFCELCSCAIPMPRPLVGTRVDWVSPGNYDRLKAVGSPKVAAGLVQVVEGHIDCRVKENARRWRPGCYLGSEFRRKKDLKADEIWLLRGFMRIRKEWIKLRRAIGYE